MAKKNYVYSTASNDTVYTGGHRRKGGGVSIPNHRIVIKGGANVYSKKYQTRQAVETEVSAEDLEKLMADDRFQKHLEDGWVFVAKGERLDLDEAAGKMASKKDKSAQLTKADFEPGKEPKTELPKPKK